MSEQEIESLIVSELSRNRAPKDLTLLVCDRTGLRWDAAQQLIERVKNRHYGSIDRRNLVITLWLSIPAILFGMFMIVGVIIGALSHEYDLVPGIPRLSAFECLAFGLLLTFGGVAGIVWRKRTWSRELLDRK